MKYVTPPWYRIEFGLSSQTVGVWFQSEQLTLEAKQLGEDVEGRVRSAVSHWEQSWRDHISWTERELSGYVKNINAACQIQTQQSEVYYLLFLFQTVFVCPPSVNILYN
jgi:hypothetical protein